MRLTTLGAVPLVINNEQFPPFNFFIYIERGGGGGEGEGRERERCYLRVFHVMVSPFNSKRRDGKEECRREGKLAMG